MVKGDVNDPYGGPGRPAEYVDGRPACLNVGSHLQRDFGGVGGYAVLRHSMITREHDDAGVVYGMRWALSLACGDPHA